MVISLELTNFSMGKHGSKSGDFSLPYSICRLVSHPVSHPVLPARLSVCLSVCLGPSVCLGETKKKRTYGKLAIGGSQNHSEAFNGDKPRPRQLFVVAAVACWPHWSAFLWAMWRYLLSQSLQTIKVPAEFGANLIDSQVTKLDNQMQGLLITWQHYERESTGL